MSEISERRAVQPAASVPPSKPPGISVILWGSLAIVAGGALAGVMIVATFYEAADDDFFGVMVSGMVVLFGFLLAKTGFYAVTGRQQTPLGPDPLDRLWQSDTRVYPYLPYSQLEIRAREKPGSVRRA